MGAEENDDKPINMLEVHPEQEPIEQVFSQEPEDVKEIVHDVLQELQARESRVSKKWYKQGLKRHRLQPIPNEYMIMTGHENECDILFNSSTTRLHSLTFAIFDTL
jgi:DNA-directed RNA polymerase sigma subunit (sigma70/sigma32)